MASKRLAEKAKFLQALRHTPIIQLASQQAGFPSRATYYRWRKEDLEFAKDCDGAIAEGVDLINDLAETKLISAIKEQNFNAISFWLRKRSPKFRDRLEVTALNLPKDELTPEQEAVVKEALRLASLNIASEQTEPMETKTEPQANPEILNQPETYDQSKQ